MQDVMKLNPTVCVVKNKYQIMVVTECEALISVCVGKKTYYNHSNGIRISSAGVHRICVPVSELDREMEYTVVIQKMIERLPYFPKSEEPVKVKYNFKPLTKTSDINLYHLSDVHGEWRKAVGAAKSYYTFRVGCVWGILVDTGEDKEDNCDEYGGTVCCHDFRLEQERMIIKTIENAEEEYTKDGVKYRIVISHVPFTFKRKAPFDIEKDLFSRWAKLIKENIKPNFMLCGHTHKAVISGCGSKYDELGQPCTVIVGSDVSRTVDDDCVLAGPYINLNEDNAKVVFNTENKVLIEKTISI